MVNDREQQSLYQLSLRRRLVNARLTFRSLHALGEPRSTLLQDCAETGHLRAFRLRCPCSTIFRSHPNFCMFLSRDAQSSKSPRICFDTSVAETFQLSNRGGNLIRNARLCHHALSGASRLLTGTNRHHRLLRRGRAGFARPQLP